MPTILRTMPPLVACLLAVLAGGLPARADVSVWAESPGGRMRVMALPPDGRGAVRGALTIEPAPGWITYWREPGDSGIPPQITFAPDSNLTLKSLDFPVPKRFDAGGVSDIGYDHAVTLPFTLAPADPARPVTFAAEVFIGLCKDICIPFQAEFSLSLGPGGEKDVEALLAGAKAALPEPASPDFSVASHAMQADGKALSVRLTLPEGAGEDVDIFVTGPPGYIFMDPETWKREGRDLTAVFAIERLPRRYEIKGKTWTLLAIAGGRAMETPLVFD